MVSATRTLPRPEGPRRFCPECGSRIATDADGIPNLTFIMAGTLDDTSWVDPTAQFWCAAQPWVSRKRSHRFRECPDKQSSELKLRIPRQSGQGFRLDLGHRSDLIPTIIPK
jgi:hypothetical protein